MKKFIGWLAQVSGVKADIINETTHNISKQMLADSHWFGANPIAYNALGLYATELNNSNVLDPNVIRIRAKVATSDYRKLEELTDIENRKRK